MLLGVLLGDLEAELLLEGQHQLDDRERVGLQVVDERGGGDELVLRHLELLADEFLDLLLDIAHGGSFRRVLLVQNRRRGQQRSPRGHTSRPPLTRST
jgi:hypothetical protein